MESKMMNAALEYAKHGYKIFPCVQRGKRPITKNGYKDASCNEKTIIEWWQKNPEANIGLPCSLNNIIVLDIDRHHDVDGIECLKKYFKKLGKLPTTSQTKTGGDGFHLFFEMNSEKDFKKEIEKGSGVDIKWNGYVIVPPSIHETEKEYKWKTSLFEKKLEKLPEKWMNEIIVSEIEAIKEPLVNHFTRGIEPSIKVQNIIHERCNLIRESVPGTRHNTICSQASYLGKISGAGYVSDEYLLQKIIEAVEVTGHEEKDSERVIIDAIKIGKQNPVTWNDDLTSNENIEWDEEPIPFDDNLPEANPFPIDALPKIMRDLANKIIDVVQVPDAIAGSSLLAGAALVVQPHLDVVNDGRGCPTSCYFISVAKSGERKSEIDKIILGPHRKFEQDNILNYSEEERNYNIQKDSFEKMMKKFDSPNIDDVLNKFKDEPQKPIYPQFLVQDPTYEGLIKKYVHSLPSLGIFNDEGGIFLGGSAMSETNMIKTIAGLSKLWGYGIIERTRAGEEAPIVLYNRRLTIHLMLQPELLSKIFGNSSVIDQGFSARLLVCYPESKIGSHKYVEENIYQTTEYREYFKIIMTLLQKKFNYNEKGLLKPREIKLSQEAKEIWIAFYNDIERRLGQKNDPLCDLQSAGSKIAEQVLRIAGILTGITNIDAEEIRKQEIYNAIKIGEFYLNEIIRISIPKAKIPDAELAKMVLLWTEKEKRNNLSQRDIQRLGPNPIRNREKLLDVLNLLNKHGWAKMSKVGQKHVWTFRKYQVSQVSQPVSTHKNT